MIKFFIAVCLLTWKLSTAAMSADDEIAAAAAAADSGVVGIEDTASSKEEGKKKKHKKKKDDKKGSKFDRRQARLKEILEGETPEKIFEPYRDKGVSIVFKLDGVLSKDVYRLLGDKFKTGPLRGRFLEEIAPQLLKVILEKGRDNPTLWIGLFNRIPELLTVVPTGCKYPFVAEYPIKDHIKELAEEKFYRRPGISFTSIVRDNMDRIVLFHPELFATADIDFSKEYEPWVYEYAFDHYGNSTFEHSAEFIKRIAPYILKKLVRGQDSTYKNILIRIIQKNPDIIFLSCPPEHEVGIGGVLNLWQPFCQMIRNVEILDAMNGGMVGQSPILQVIVRSGQDRNKAVEQLNSLAASGVFNDILPPETYQVVFQYFKDGKGKLHKNFSEQIVPYLLRAIVEKGQETPDVWLPLLGMFPSLLEEAPLGVSLPFYFLYPQKSDLIPVANAYFKDRPLELALLKREYGKIISDETFIRTSMTGIFKPETYALLAILYAEERVLKQYHERFMKKLAPYLLKGICDNNSPEFFPNWHGLIQRMPQLLEVAPAGYPLPFYLQNFSGDGFKPLREVISSLLSPTQRGHFVAFNGDGGFYDVFIRDGSAALAEYKRTQFLRNRRSNFPPDLQDLFVKFMANPAINRTWRVGLLSALMEACEPLRQKFLLSPCSFGGYEFDLVKSTEDLEMRMRALMAGLRISNTVTPDNFRYEEHYKTAQERLNHLYEGETPKVRQFTDYYRLDYAHVTGQTAVTPALWDWLYANDYFKHTATDHAAAAFWVGWEVDEGRGGVLAPTMIDSLINHEDAFRGAASMSASSANALRAVETLTRANALAHELDLDLAPSGADAKRVVSTRALDILKGADYGINPQPATVDEFKRIRKAVDDILLVQGDFALGVLGADLDWEDRSLQSLHQQNLYLLAAHDYADMTGGTFELTEPVAQQWRAMQRMFEINDGLVQ